MEATLQKAGGSGLPRPCSSGLLSLPDYLRRLSFPDPSRRRLPGHVAFAMLQVLCSRRTADRASLATSLALIGSLYLGATQGLCQLSRGHALFFRTVPPAITLVNGWVNENAFAPE